MMENHRSQVELLYRDINILLKEINRLQAENSVLKHNNDRLRVENKRLSEDNERLINVYTQLMIRNADGFRDLKLILNRLHGKI